MEAVDLVARQLEYDQSPNYRPIKELFTDPDHGFIYRKAEQGCHVHGVYLLRGRHQPSGQADVPVVYISYVDSDQQALEVHRRVWNQDLVPFLIVISPKFIRLYPGFRYDYSPDKDRALRTLGDFTRVPVELRAFRASGIDSGELWRQWGDEVCAQSRVDWRLLGNLRSLSNDLATTGLDDPGLIHGVIGKFVYLRYLRDRNILSIRKLESWGLDEATTLSRQAEPKAFCELNEHLDEWLNGSVFPLTSDQVAAFGVKRLRRVAGIFYGDSSEGQLALEFANYDFSFIPIETLSVIYEQFLHAPKEPTGETRGRQLGAYYTPIPVVNYMIDRLAREHPLRAGMRILDPACGSGAFLVQCYRRLLEGQFSGKEIPPQEARRILTESIFGIDTDPDASQIAELSLILTLLDYVKPPDLEAPNLRRFLPVLTGRNIFRGDAFSDSFVDSVCVGEGFDWVIGNPPWKRLRKARDDDRRAVQFAEDHRKEYPIGGLQVAELFAWRSLQLLAEGAIAGLLLPAMTLFKSESERFRQEFFGRAAVWSVTNFANLANVLFGRRSTVPAMAFFFRRATANLERDSIEVYTPFLANQPALRNGRSGHRRKSWNLIVNASEIKEVSYAEALSGNSLIWKIAAWGSFLDRRLLDRIEHRHRKLSSLEDEGLIVLSQGLETRGTSADGPVEHHPELAGRERLAVKALKRRRHLLQFPRAAIEHISEHETDVRKGRFALPFRVSQSPHVIVSASRSFAVYDEQSIVVPPRQIGIAAESAKPRLLRALALYLNSDFAFYHQFFATAEAGIQKTRNTLDSLRALPVPFTGPESTRQWDELFSYLLAHTQGRDDFGDPDLRDALNQLTARSLGLNDRERAVVEEFVKVRRSLMHGKVTEAAVGEPKRPEMETYATTLRDELDDFIGEETAVRHSIGIVANGQTALLEVKGLRHLTEPQPVRFSVSGADFEKAYTLARKYFAAGDYQWVYFRRDLRIYAGASTYLFKPLERLHWTRTQAMLDAAELLAEMLSPEADRERHRG